MQTPEFSIVIPVYNQEKYVERCLESVQAQTVTNFEVIVVDDGSQDHTTAVVERVINDDPRFRLVRHTTNRGVSAARNTGMVGIKSPYTTFIDGDDWVEPDFLAQFKKAYAQHPDVDLVICGHHGYLALPTPARTYDHEELVSTINFGTVGGFSWNKCFLTKTIQTNQLQFNESLDFLEDQLFAFQYADHTQKALYFPEKTYHYRWRIRFNFAHVGSNFFNARKKMLKILQADDRLGEKID